MPKKPQPAPEIVPQQYGLADVDSIQPHPDNVNEGDEGAIYESIKELGFYGSCLVQKSTGYIIAGKHRRQAAVDAGMKYVPAIFIDCTDDEAVRIMLADNQTARLGNDNPAKLSELLIKLRSTERGLKGTAFKPTDLDDLLADIRGRAQATLLPHADPDNVPEPEPAAETRVKAGDVWQLGEHKLACIDCLDRSAMMDFMGDDVPAMIFADPPYGLNIVTGAGFVGGGERDGIPFGGTENPRKRGNVGSGAAHLAQTGKPYINDARYNRPAKTGTTRRPRLKIVHDEASADEQARKRDLPGKYLPVVGDDTTKTAIDAYDLCFDMFPKAVHVWWGGNYYANALPPSSCWLVWDKKINGDFADAELAWTNQKTAVRLFQHMWNGLLKASEQGQRRIHPTQKPVALAQWVFEKYGTGGSLVLDPFAGSGMSIMAGEVADRRVYACEIVAEYCDLIIKRWETATGKEAVFLFNLAA